MNSTSHSSTLLILLIFIHFLLHFHVEAEIEKVSGEVNVEGGELSMAMLAKLRMLLGLHTSSTASNHRRAHDQLHPAESPSPLPSLHKLHVNMAPLPNRRHSPLVQRTDNHFWEHQKATRRKHLHLIVAIFVSVLVALAIFGIMAVVVLVQRRRQKIDLHCNVSSKVSFDPEPEMFYFDSLAPFLESGSDHKLSSELKSAASVESIVRDTLQIEAPTLHLTLNSENKPDEAANHFESLSSDGSDSFHSIYCSHCSVESMSAFFEPNLDRSPANDPSSPLTSSNLNVFSTQSMQKPRSSTGLIPYSIRKTPLPPLVTSQLTSTPENEDDITPLFSTQSPNVEMTLEANWSFSQDTKSTNLYDKTPSESRNQVVSTDQESAIPVTVDIMNSTKQLKTLQIIKGQQIPSTSINNGSIPKPPPPPPPPFQKRNSFIKSASPHFQPQQSVAVDKDGNLLPKLKPLHWDKVRAASDRSMVWDKIRSSSFVLDEKTIESLFGYNMNCSLRNEESKSKNSLPSIEVFEHKRLQNITILLKALNATTEQVCNALILGCGLDPQQLETLAKMAPTKEEEEKLSKYEGFEELESTEKFLKVILRIPLAFSRIEIMLYRKTFDDEVIHLKNSFAIIEEACKELRSSRLFLRLLEAVLKTGNRMNVGTIRGGARAFKLDALLKLADVKGTDGKTTLLHFVVQEMIKSQGINTHEKINDKFMTRSTDKSSKIREEDNIAKELNLVSALGTELSNVKKTATIDLDVLASSVSNLSKGMSKLKEVLEEGLSRDEMDLSFVNTMRSFQNQGDGIIRELKNSVDRVFCYVREITEYYHGDVSKDEVNPLQIFVIVSDFLSMLDRVCKELRSSKGPLTLNLNVSLAKSS